MTTPPSTPASTAGRRGPFRRLGLVVALTWSSALAGTDVEASYPVDSAPTAIPAGAYVIDMGIAPQTIANGLKPYGLVYALIQAQVPVQWAINDTKLKDGPDFTIGAKTYAGGSFIIPAEFAAEAAPIVATWRAQGVVVDGPISTPFTAPVFELITSWPRVVLDTGNGKLAAPYYVNAGIPTTSYRSALPSALTACDDLYTMPHADPAWATHSNLVTFNNNGGYIWAACHAVSVLENVDSPTDADTAPNMNFLTTTGAVPFGSHADAVPPYSYLTSQGYDPIMQFIGTLDGATNNGSEQVYLPARLGGWRPTSTVLVWDPDHANVPALSPGKAAKLVYGRGFGVTTNGLVMYEGGHSHENGTIAERVAAQRAYFNLHLLAGIEKSPDISIDSGPTTLGSGATTAYTSSTTGGTPGYTHSWSSSCRTDTGVLAPSSGSFATPTSPNSTFTAPTTSVPLNCTLRVRVVDSCGRSNFDWITVRVLPPADVRITKAESADPVVAGGNLTYTLTVTNAGPGEAAGVVVSDPLPVGLTPVSVTTTLGTCAFAGSTLTCDVTGTSTMASGTSATITVVTATAATGVNSVSNTATVTSTSPDPTPGNNSASVTTAIIHPAFTIDKSTTTPVIAGGGTASYTYLVTNTGDAAFTPVAVSDNRCSPLAGPVGDAAPIGVLGVGEIWTYTCSTTLAADTTNTVTVNATDPTGVVRSLADTAFVDTVTPGLSVSKGPDAQLVLSGGTATFFVTVSNTGDVDLTNVAVSDPSAPGCATTIPLLAAGTAQDISCTVAGVTSGFTNTVNVTAANPLGGTLTASDTAVVAVGVPAMTIDKSAPAGPFRPGDLIPFTITVANSGTITQDAVVVSDVAPAGTTWVSTSIVKPNLVAASDDFQAGQVYTGGSGWASGNAAWLEAGDDANPADGSIRVVAAGFIGAGDPATNALRMRFDTAAGSGTLTRGVALAGATSATVSYTVRVNGINNSATQQVFLEASLDGTTWSAPLATHNTNNAAPIPVSVTIPPALLGPGTQIRFRAIGNWPGGVNNGNGAYFDNVAVNAVAGTTTVSGGAPPSLTSAGGPYTLPPGASLTATVTLRVDDPLDPTITQLVNAAAVSSTQQPTPISDTATISIVNPSFTVAKSASAPLVRSGDSVIYTYVVENTGNGPLNTVTISDSHCSSVTGPTADSTPLGVLDVDEAWTYTCTQALSATTTNTVTVASRDVTGAAVGPETSQATVQVISPQIDISVAPSNPVVRPDDPVTLTYTITNTGDSPLIAIAVSDPACSPIGGFVEVSGNGDLVLDPGEVWTFTCTAIAGAVDLTSTPTVSSTDPLGGSVTDIATTTIDVINPALAIDKSASANNVAPGTPVTFTIAVTNPGDDPLTPNTPALDDPTCPPTFQGGDTDGDNRLDPGETWTYTCTQPLFDDVTNTAIASFRDSLGVTLTDFDSAAVNVLVGSLAISKIGDVSAQYLGNPVTYTFKVENTGETTFDSTAPGGLAVSDDYCSPLVRNADLAGNGDDQLEPGETWAYSCTKTLVLADVDAVSGGVTDTLAVTANDGASAIDLTDTFFVFALEPQFAVTKVATPDQLPADGGDVTYRFTIVNTSRVPTQQNHLTVIAVSDPQCDSPIVFTGGDDGDNELGFIAGVSETWIYECTSTLAADTTNVVTVTAQDSQGGVLEETATEFVNVAPRIVVTKTASPTEIPAVGAPVTFTISVSNTGSERVTLTTLNDDVFGGLDGRGDCTLPQTIDPASFYTCSFAVPIANGPPGSTHTNVVTANAEDDEGTVAIDTDDAVVTRGSAVIGNFVWLDRDGDGVQDAGEPGLAGVTVELLDATGAVVVTTTSAADGSYAFIGVAAGSYRVRFTQDYGAFSPQDAATATDATDSDADPLTGTTALFSVATGAITNDVDAGIVGTASIAGTVVLDRPLVGALGAADVPLAGITVNATWAGPDGISGNADDIVYTAVTGVDGSFSFVGLPAGDYSVDVVETDPDFPLGVVSSFDPDAIADGVDPVLTLAAGESVVNEDFGYLGQSSLSGSVLLDRAGDGPGGDGVPSETPLSGVTVTATWQSPSGPVVFTTTTLADGSYSFSGLPAGDFVITVDQSTLPPGLTASFDPPLDGDGTNGSFPISLSAGQSATGLDFGFREAPNPALALTKTGAPATFDAVGDVITYTFLIENTGNRTLTAVSVDDDFLGGAAVDCGAPPVTLGIDDTVSCTASYTIQQADLDRGFVTNNATATGDDPNGDPVTSAVATETVDAVQNPVLSLTKLGSPATYAAVGDAIDYTYTIRNDGNVTIRAPFTVADDTIATVTCPATPTSLLPGQTLICTATYTIVQADIDRGFVTNIASAAGVGPLGAVTSPDATETVNADLRADLGVVKTVTSGATTHVPGNQLSYTLTVTNHGPSVTTTTTLTDRLPADATYVSAAPDNGGTCTVAASVVSCALGSLAIDEVVVVTVVVDIDPASTADLTNEAEITSNLPDPVLANNISSVTTTADPQADLVVDKTAPATYVPGQPISYTVAVRNDGPSTAIADVVVTDTLPTGLTFVAADSDPRCSAAGAIVTCTRTTSLAPAGFDAFTIAVDSAASLTTPLDNTAEVTSPTPDPDLANNAETVTSGPTPLADVSITKSGPTLPVAAGTQIDFTLVVSNAGPSDAAGVTVSDVLPAGLTFVSATVSGGIGTETCTATISCALGIVTPTSPERITIRAAIDPAATGDRTNSATVTTTTAGDDPANNADDHTITIVERSDVGVVKVDSVDPVRAGEQLTYTITVTNTGPSQATNVSISDRLPAGTTFVSAPGCTETAGDVTCTIAALAVGVPTSFDVTVVVGADVPDGTQLSNTATVSAASDTNPANDSATEPTDVVAEADLVISKSSTPDPFVPGQPLTYVISVINLGPSDAQNVSLTDALPTDFTPASVDPATSCSLAGNDLSCSLTTLAFGDQLVVMVVGGTAPSATTLSNTANVTSTTTDPVPGNNEALDVNVGDPSADLEVTKVDSVDPVAAGAALTYTIVVTNKGPSDATNVVVTDTPPAGYTVSAVDRVECNTTISCTFATIAAGTSETIVVTGAVGSGVTDTGDPLDPELVNTVSVTSDTTDPVLGNNSDTEPTDVIESADLVITKVEQGSDVTPGGQRTYRIRVADVGPSDADNVVVTDVLPAGLTFVSATGATCNASGQSVSCPLGTIVAGAPVVVITVVVDVDPSVIGPVSNTATVASTTPDPVQGNNEATSQDPTAPVADLTIDKTDLSDPVLAGTQLTYRLTGQNLGPSTARAAIVTDDLPLGTAFVSGTITTGTGSCSATGGTVSCNLGALLPGAIYSIDIVVDVLASVPDGTVLANDAAISSDTPDPDTTNNTDTEPTTVEAEADIGVTKLAIPDPATPGRSITYEIRVTNFGPSDALGVAISDDLPAGLSNVAAAVTGTVGASCTIADPLTCDLGTLTPDQEVLITITADIDPDQLANLANSVTVTTTTTDPNPANDTDATDTPLAPEADLEIAKSGPATVVAGTSMSYTLVVTNRGPADAANVVITDTLPAGLTLTGATVLTGTGACVATTCTFASVPFGTTASVRLDVDVASSVLAGTVLSNTADVTTDTPDPNAANDSDVHDTTVQTSADLSITKTASIDPFRPGVPFTYTLVVLNGGPSDARAVTVTDPVPAGLTVTNVTTTVPSCTFDALAVDCALGTLIDGGQVDIVVTVRPDASLTGSVDNTATVASTTPDPNAANNESTATTTAAPAADLQVTKTADLIGLVAGAPVTYTLSVVNGGPSTAVAPTLTDVLPAEVVYVSHIVTSPVGTCTYDAPTTTISCANATLLPGATISVDVTVTVDASVADGATISNTASASSSTFDPDLANNDGELVLPVDAVADVRISKSLLGMIFIPGTPGRYQLVVTNDGPSDAQAVQVLDTLPAGLTVTSVATDRGTCTDTPTSITCDIPTLAADDVATITVDVDTAADLAGDVSNTATVGSSTIDPNLANNEAVAVNSADPAVDLAVVKSTRTNPVVPGQPVVYDLLVTNAGPSDAIGVTLVDTLPVGVTATAASTDQGSCAVAGATVTCTLGVVPDGGVIAISITADVAPQLLGTITNVAAVSSATDELDPTNNSDSVSDPLAPAADLAVTKTGPTTATGGDTINYQLTVTNAGPSTARDVMLSDQLPAGVTFVSASPGCTLAASVATCAVGSVAPGATAIVDVTVRIPDVLVTTNLRNTAAVSGTTPDPDPSDNTAAIDTLVAADLGTLVGLVWQDDDGDGVRDPGEAGIPGVTVRVTGDPDGDGIPNVLTFVTGPDGAFTTPLPPGSLTVAVDQSTVPFGMAATTPTSASVTIQPNVTSSVQFGEAFGSISGRVWFDVDADGVADPGERDIAAVRVIVVCPGPDGLTGTADDMQRTGVTASPFVVTGLPIGQTCQCTLDAATLPASVRQTFDPDGVLDGATRTVVVGAVNEALNFGYVSAALPRTGSESLALSRTALLLLAAGLGLAGVARRRYATRR